MNNDTVTLLQAHRSIRKFKDRPIAQDDIDTIIACGQSAATSSNIQAVTVIQVNDADARQQLATHAGGQADVATASAFFVFCADLNRNAQASAAQGGDFAAGMTEQFIIASIDVALFAQNSVIAAESMGFGICYIGGLRNNPQAVSQMLELPKHVYPVFGLCIGHPDQDPDIKPRLPLQALLQQDTYNKQDYSADITSYDETIREYYRSRTGDTKDSCWSEEMKALIGSENRPHMRKFLQSKGFDLR